MEPITAITTALALGAASALKNTTENIFKDCYAALKSLIIHKFPQTTTSVEQLEQVPDSKARQNLVEEDLTKAGAIEDLDVLLKAKELLELIEKKAPAMASVIGVDLEDIKGGALRISDIISTGAGVKIKGAEIGGDIEIKGVHAGQIGGNPKNPF
jgi:hypothetical protein